MTSRDSIHCEIPEIYGFSYGTWNPAVDGEVLSGQASDARCPGAGGAQVGSKAWRQGPAGCRDGWSGIRALRCQVDPWREGSRKLGWVLKLHAGGGTDLQGWRAGHLGGQGSSAGSPSCPHLPKPETARSPSACCFLACSSQPRVQGTGGQGPQRPALQSPARRRWSQVERSELLIGASCVPPPETREQAQPSGSMGFRGWKEPE